MINFEEELSKFKPSKEIEQAEDVIVNMNLRDMTDGCAPPDSCGKRR